MRKINLTEFVRKIEVWKPWLDNYKKYIPKFIEEASKGINWNEWNSDTFYMYFSELTEHPVSSLKQGYFTNKERERIKNNWMDFAPDLKEIAISQDIPKFELYDKVVKTINDMCDNNRYASIYRMIAGLQPNLLCTIVNVGKLDSLCRFINEKCDIDIDLSGDYFHRSNKICLLFNSIMSDKNPIDNATLPWQTLEEFNELEKHNYKMKKTFFSIANSLEYNKNIILTGAPGTGKTYLAKELAYMMITGKANVDDLTEEEKKMYDEQHGFVQFHPSYDYTDFVEGLRPIQDENGNVGFERRDGVFKSFCETAIKSSFAKGSDNFDEIWDKLVSHLNANSFIEIPLLTGARNIRIELNEYGTGLTERLYSDNNACGEMEKVRGHSKFFTKEQLYNIYRGFKGVPSGGHDNYRKAIIDYLKKNMGLVEYSAGQHGENGKKFVFIIDEINRGDISKIFGELFFSIDPGYRGMDGAVRTQYANMQTSPNEFDLALKITDSSNCGHFFVPENVYIIGTMNDIDRSVESMDFAMRRRFAFKEICAEDRMDMIKENSKLTQYYPVIEQRMRNLNLAILTIQGLSKAYQIGAAYYLKLDNYLTEDGTIDDSSWKMLWDNHLYGLLFEYLRVLPNADDDMEKLKQAYNMNDRYEIKDGKPEIIKDNA